MAIGVAKYLVIKFFFAQIVILIHASKHAHNTWLVMVVKVPKTVLHIVTVCQVHVHINSMISIADYS